MTDTSGPLLPPRLEEGYSATYQRPNRFGDTASRFAAPALEAARGNLEASRGGVGAYFGNMALGALNLADAAARYGVGTFADLIPGLTANQEADLARELYAIPEAFMGASPARGANLLDDLLEGTANVAAARNLGELASFQRRAGQFQPDAPRPVNYFVPTPDELARMEADSTPAQADYLLRRREAMALKNEGVSNEEIFAETGIDFIPVRGADGELMDEIPALPTGDSQVNTERLQELFAQGEGASAPLSEVLLPSETLLGLRGEVPGRIEITENVPGVAGYDIDRQTILINPRRATPATLEAALRHENVHGIMRSGGRAETLGGRAPRTEADLTQEYLGLSRTARADARARLESGELTQDQFDEIDRRISAAEAGLLVSPRERYSRNLGEMLAREAMGDSDPRFSKMSMTLTPGETRNPLIRPGVSAPVRYGQAALASLFPYSRLARADAAINRGIETLGRPLERFFPEEAGRPPTAIMSMLPTEVRARVPQSREFATESFSTISPSNIVSEVAAGGRRNAPRYMTLDDEVLMSADRGSIDAIRAEIAANARISNSVRLYEDQVAGGVAEDVARQRAIREFGIDPVTGTAARGPENYAKGGAVMMRSNMSKELEGGIGGFADRAKNMFADGGEVGMAPPQGSVAGRAQSGPAIDVYTGAEGDRLNEIRQRIIREAGVDPVQIAAEEGIDPNLMLNVIAQESGGRANARSDAGAYGYMQLMEGTARELGVDRTDPVQNLRGGARYLRQQIERFNDVPLALAAYNAGPTAVERYGGIPPYSETRAYVANILGLPGGQQAVVPPRRPEPVMPVPRPAVGETAPVANPLTQLGSELMMAPAQQVAQARIDEITQNLTVPSRPSGLQGIGNLMRNMP